MRNNNPDMTIGDGRVQGIIIETWDIHLEEVGNIVMVSLASYLHSITTF